MNRTKFVLFICLSVRYHYTREVATHENPERTKDEQASGLQKLRLYRIRLAS